ncbi:transposable element Tcb2 transposase [Trichonephila clavipes]|uniref:Transposable element Tcb2 transposase n=1 Tax=Trichonephila clavipes TaxID=2585209 RepID=A0A8X7BE17_TRICX|nr:transposable element Tcb2 transposase [Trichonephila clavipes]
MREADCSRGQAPRQLGRYVCVVRRCWDQRIREKSFTRRPGSGRTCQNSHREDHHIVRNIRIQPTASSATIQTHLASLLGTHVSSRTIRWRLAEGHLGSRRQLRVLSLTPTHRHHHLGWYHARGNLTSAEWNQVILSYESRFNLRSDDKRVRVWRPRNQRLKLAFVLQRHTVPTARVMVLGAIAYNTRSPLRMILGTVCDSPAVSR